MNNVFLRGVITDIEPSHVIDDIEFSKAKLICKRPNGKEDMINLRFKAFSNTPKEDTEITIEGNLRSYSYRASEDKNKVLLYVFTYFDAPEEEHEGNNRVELDGRICKINELRTTQNGKHNIHFILANNIINHNNSKRLNSYIPCIAWGKLAKDLSKLTVNANLKLIGEIHAREHKKVHPDGTVEFRVAHELVVNSFEVISNAV